MSPSSFNKGEAFEKYVETVLFPEENYVLVHRTNSYEQNKNRYAENTLKPDFMFRCKKTDKEFYVEAKYRAGFNENEMLDIMSTDQKNRYKNVQKEEEKTVLIAIGYKGTPNNPYKVSIVPLDELDYLKLYHSFLKKHWVDLSNKEKLQEDIKTKINQKVKAKKSYLSNSWVKLIGVAAIALFLICSYQYFKKDYRQVLKQKTKEYYMILDSGNVDELENYLNPILNRWYSKSNLTFDQVKKDIIRYSKKYPRRSADIQYNTFEITKIENGYSVNYTMIYKLWQKNKTKKIYHLKIKTIWSNDYKIKSMIEEKL